MPNFTGMKIAGVNPMVANYKSRILWEYQSLAMLCKHYNPMTGTCKNGPTCTFAHGE